MWFYEKVTERLSINEILINFLPSWWYRNYQISYGKPMVFDYHYRISADQEMRKLFYERFGKQLNAGTSDPHARFIYPDWDNTYYQTMLGFDTRYPVDQYPISYGRLSDEDVLKLKVPENIWTVFPYNEQARQIIEMNKELGTDMPPWIRTRGILNECVQIRGSDFYGELLDEDFDKITEHICNFILSVIEQQLTENKKYNAETEHVMMNCTAAIAGPPTYRKRIYQFDKAIYDFCLNNHIKIGLHHCGKYDDFVDIYSSFTKLHFIEIGHSSKIRPVLEKNPNAQVQYIVDTKFMQESDCSKIKEFCESIKEQIFGYEKRVNIALPDLEYGTPDENILAFVEAFRV